MNQDVYTGVDGGFLIEPHFAIRDSPALDADHAALSNDITVTAPAKNAAPTLRPQGFVDPDAPA
jgi:hypothetical protein